MASEVRWRTGLWSWEGFFMVTRRNRELSTNSVRLRNLVVGRWSNFLPKISILSVKYEWRPSAEVGRSRRFGECVWNGHLESAVRIPTGRACLLAGVQHPFLLHHLNSVPLLAEGYLLSWLWSGGETWLSMSKSQQRRQLSPWQSPRPGSAVKNIARDLFTAFCNPWRVCLLI